MSVAGSKNKEQQGILLDTMVSKGLIVLFLRSSENICNIYVKISLMSLLCYFTSSMRT